MSRKRNRGVKTLPTNNLLLEFPLPSEKNTINNVTNSSSKHDSKEALLVESNYFGETIKDKNGLNNNYNYYSHNYPNSNYWSSGDTIDTITVGFNNVSLGKSSSSSLSWSDEYDNEASKKIQAELEKVERILCGAEDIPPYYDEDEFKQWMETFPFLSILGKRIPPKKSAAQKIEIVNRKEEIFAIHPDPLEFNQYNSSKGNETKRDIKKAVIDKLYHNISNRLLNKNQDLTIKKEIKLPLSDKKINSSFHRNSPIPHRNFSKNNKLNVDLEVNNYLKISPVLQRRNLRKRNNRQHSSKSLVTSQISSAKWLKEESPEFNSLPFLTEELQENLQKKKVARRRSKNTVILPPIQANNLFSNNYFRSISAIPIQQQNKSLSAFSFKGKSHLSDDKPIHQENKTLIKNFRELRNISRIPLRLKKWDTVDS